MALHWTYGADFANVNPGYTTGSTIGQRDQIRFLIQDTKTTRQLLFDEEIDWTQVQEANVFMAAAACCDVLLARFVGLKSKQVGDLKEEFDPAQYRQIGAQMRARGSSHQLPYVGGISIADKLAQEADPDWVEPRMTIDEFDNPGANQPGPGTTPQNPGFPNG